MVHENRNVSLKEIAEELDCSTATVHTVLHNDLGMSKKAARWVPHALTEEQKKKRVNMSEAALKLLESKVSIVTMDETMVSFHTPLAKRQSKEWRPKGAPAPTKPCDLRMHKKQMLLTFFDINGLIYTRYAPVGTKVCLLYTSPSPRDRQKSRMPSSA